jgi:ABC-type branched-subunit amino acid transport system ATPase component
MSVLELVGISKSFDGIKAVDSVFLDFSSNKITALIGPNGAGKTTVFNLISGFLKPDEGNIKLKGQNLIGLPPFRIAGAGIGRLFQDVRIFKEMSVLDNVMAAFNEQTGEMWWAPLIKPFKVKKQEKAFVQRADQLLKFVGLLEKRDDLAESLSYGQQKLLSIARLLASDAEILLLDEPTAGVSPAMVPQLLDLIRALRDQGKAIILIEHNLNVVTEIGDWVFFMDEGQVTYFGLPADVLGNPDVRQAYIGL